MGGAILWLTTQYLLQSDRAIDLGDEGLYLLASDPPSPTASYVFPFGWHTRPLFALVGYDVASFRTGGAVLLSVVGVWVATGVARVIQEAQLRADPWLVWLSGAAGLGGAWFYYFTLLRAPSYNWVTLMGLGIASGACLRLWSLQLRRTRPDIISQAHLWLQFFVAGFGITFSLAAKPTSPIFFGIVFALVATTTGGIRLAVRALLLLVIASIAWIPILILVRWWPIDFVEVFYAAVTRPLVSDQQTPVEAIQQLIKIPSLTSQDFRGTAALPVATVGMALLALASNVVKPWPRPLWLLAPFVGIVGIAPFFAQSSLEIWQQGWERGNINVAMMLVVTAMLFIGLGRWNSKQRISRTQMTSAVVGFIVLSGAFGFASTNTPYPMMKFAGILLVGAALMPLVRVPLLSLRRALAAVVAVAALVSSTSLIIRSWATPYASAPIAYQSIEVEVGSHGARILVDSMKAEVLSTMRQTIHAAGGSDIRLISIGPETPGVGYATGATAPETLMLTWYGLPGDIDLARANLARIDRDSWCDAWVLTKPWKDETDQVADLYATASGRQWPGDYTQVASVNGFTLWRPQFSCTGARSGGTAISRIERLRGLA